MAQGFNAQLRSQREWGWLSASWFFLGGTGSSSFLLYEVLGLPPAFGLLSIALVVIGGMLLLSGLGNPARAWRGAARIGSSWLSRGAVSVGVFLVCSVLSLAPALATDLPWSSQSAAAATLGWIAALFAAAIALYPGFFLAGNRSIPFWNTPLLPLISVGISLMGGDAVALIASGWLAQWIPTVEAFGGALAAMNFLLLLALLFSSMRAGAAGAESVRLLNRGLLGWLFWIGAVLVGMLMPLVLVWSEGGRSLAGVCMLIGCFAFRYCVLKAGVYVPAAVPEAGHTGRFSPVSEHLRREYGSAR